MSAWEGFALSALLLFVRSSWGVAPGSYEGHRWRHYIFARTPGESACPSLHLRRLRIYKTRLSPFFRQLQIPIGMRAFAPRTVGAWRDLLLARRDGRPDPPLSRASRACFQNLRTSSCNPQSNTSAKRFGTNHDDSSSQRSLRYLRNCAGSSRAGQGRVRVKSNATTAARANPISSEKWWVR